MHIAGRLGDFGPSLIPSLTELPPRVGAGRKKPSPKIVKIGRTHTPGRDAADAGPGNFSGYAAQVEERHRAAAAQRCGELYPAGARRHRGRHRPQLETEIRPAPSPGMSARITRLPFTSALNKFEAPRFQRRLCLSARRQSMRPRPACSRSPTTFACSDRGPRSGLGGIDPARERAGARRSCRARSIRRNARP